YVPADATHLAASRRGAVATRIRGRRRRTTGGRRRWPLIEVERVLNAGNTRSAWHTALPHPTRRRCGAPGARPPALKERRQTEPGRRPATIRPVAEELIDACGCGIEACIHLRLGNEGVEESRQQVDGSRRSAHVEIG